MIQKSHIRGRAVATLATAILLLSACSTVIPAGRAPLAQAPVASVAEASGPLPIAPAPEPRQPVQTAAAAAPDSPRPTPTGRHCFKELAKAKVLFSPLPNREFAGGCNQINAIKVLDFGIGVTNVGAVKCQLANKFAGWTEFGVKRAARRFLGSELVTIETYGTYNCRKIAKSGKLSQHAYANAIDISGFVLADGRHITIEGDWNKGKQERRFLNAVYHSACKRFRTVLGPDYNAAHYNHFHFDMGGSGFCG